MREKTGLIGATIEVLARRAATALARVAGAETVLARAGVPRGGLPGQAGVHGQNQAAANEWAGNGPLAIAECRASAGSHQPLCPI